MKVRVRFVGAEHYATRGLGPDELVAFWKAVGLVGCDDAVIATHHRKLVGVFRFKVRGRFLAACGTWVDAEYRRQRLARRLWDAVGKRYRIREVFVSTATDAGAAFVESVPWIREAEARRGRRLKRMHDRRQARVEEAYRLLRSLGGVPRLRTLE